MAFPGEGILSDLVGRLANKTITEVNYFRHFDAYVRMFEQEHNELDAKLEEVNNDIEDAKRRNENPTKVVEVWKDKACSRIQENHRIKQKLFDSSCPHWRYRQGRRLAKRMLAMKDHLQKCSFDRMARPAKLPGIKYHVSGDFMDFESRKSKLKELVEALEDGNHYMVGLQGMGGTGKTTLATQVGKQIEESIAFEKVIFVVVSNPPDISKIRDEIAGQLRLPLNKAVEGDDSKLLWSTISKLERKLLIILDDVWEKLNLTNIGIPYGPDHKNCFVLITTRHSRVCEAMRCEKTIHLHTLTDEDALDLFLYHATSNNGPSREELEDLARGFVKECGGLPIAIASLATTLRIWPVSEWKEALATLRKSQEFLNVDEDLVSVYRCLSLSYENLRDDKARKLFLLCSIFPEDYEIPINLIFRLGIGAGIFGKVENYCARRRQVLGLKNELVASTLLLKVDGKDCVKMHDLVREVALWIAKEDIQVIMDSTTLETSKRIVFWSTNDFPDPFDGTKLEILFLWIRRDALVKNPETLFPGLAGLTFLFLLGRPKRHSIPSLLQSLLSLKNLQTLILDSWELGDVSILKYLQSLLTLELENCRIIELPIDIEQLKKLRLLGLQKCEIQKNNPFEVIERCFQLQEIYFVKNKNIRDWKPKDDREIKDEITHDISLTKLEMFSISYDGFGHFYGDDNGMLRCFNTYNMVDLLSKAMFKYIVGRAEVLELGKREETGWKCLIPDIVPVEYGGMNDLIKLYLYDWDEIECLIDTRKGCCSKAFSKLVELHLHYVDVKELCSGSPPSRFLEKLKILNLMECKKLHNIFFHENFKVTHLKVLKLSHCPMFQPSIFPLSVAQSLVQLEELTIEHCEELKSLITYESIGNELGDVDHQKGYGLLFQNLKYLNISYCDKLELVSPLFLIGDLPLLWMIDIWSCAGLKYVFDKCQSEGRVSHQEVVLPSLETMKLSYTPNFISMFREFKKCMPMPSLVLKEESKGKDEYSNMSAFSWPLGYCSLPATKDTDKVRASNGTMPHHHPILAKSMPRSPLAMEDSKDKHVNSMTSIFTWAHGCCFLTPTKDSDVGDSNAALEHHTISQESCATSKKIETFHTTECLVRQPFNLQNIRRVTLMRCSKLKSLFSVSIARTIMLEYLFISDCEELKHIITNEGENDDHLNSTSIFSELQSLDIRFCDQLEFAFPCTFSGGLQKLKYIDIWKADELKYVFGKYLDEGCLSNENKNSEPHIDLPALEKLSLSDVPNMRSICIKNFQLECSSLQTVEAPKEIKEHMGNVTSEAVKESEIIEIVNVDSLMTSTVGFQYFLNFHNLKCIEIWGNQKLRIVFSVSACKRLPQLSDLSISTCEELVSVVEEASNYDHPTDYRSIFPKMERLSIMKCNKLEFIFPFSLPDGLQKLKSLEIHKAANLKYIFGKYDDGDHLSNENESDELHIDLPALKKLSLKDVPKMINNIWTKKCNLRLPSLQSIDLDVQEFSGRSFVDLIAYLQGIAPEELEDEHKTSKSTTQVQHGDLAERKTTIKASHKSNAPFADDSVDPIIQERVQEGPTSKDAAVAITMADLAAANSSSELITALQKEFPANVAENFPKDTSIVAELHKETEKEVGEVIVPASKLPATTSFDSKSLEIGKEVAGKATASTLNIDSSNSKSSRTGEGVVRVHASHVPMATTSINPESVKEAATGIDETITTMDTSPMATPIKSEFINLLTNKEAKDSIVQEELEPKKPKKPNLPEVASSVHHQSQIGDVSTSSPKLGVCEIFQLVELKDGETAILAQALEQYPLLLLPHEHRSHRMIAWSYRVLVDILVVLDTKTPCTITSSEKSTLEANLCDATFLGFDKDWVDSIRARVFGVDMSDVLVAEEEIQVMEAELETCDNALEKVRRQRVEAKERLVVARRKLEMAQTEIEAIDSQLSSLLEDHKKLLKRIADFREIISAKDRPFGI